MSVGTFYTTPTWGVGNGIRAAAAYGGVKIDLPTDYTHYQTNLTPEFLQKFPLGKIPAWEGKDGFCLTEAVAVARYLASLAPNSTLLGSTPHESALIDQWLSFAMTEINAPLRVVFGLVNGFAPYFKPLHTSSVESAERALKALNTHLATRTFVVTERLTVADFLVAGTVQFALKTIFDAKLRAQLPNVVRHFETVSNQPSVKEIYGKTDYLETALTYTPPKKEEKPKVEKPKKEEKKAEKPKKVEEDDDDDDKPFEEPKPKHPLDLLPKIKPDFMDEWKRVYSNNETRGAGGAIETFYKTFDKKEYSIWRVEYKYNTELQRIFMSNNLVGGFFNRLEASRKYLFGSLCVCGKDNDNVITGVFIIRGQDIMPVVEVAPDWESYEFKPVNLEVEDDKKFFEASLAWDLQVNGKECAEGKNFK